MIPPFLSHFSSFFSLFSFLYALLAQLVGSDGLLNRRSLVQVQEGAPFRGVGQFGSPSALGAESRGFKSLHSDSPQYRYVHVVGPFPLESVYLLKYGE